MTDNFVMTSAASTVPFSVPLSLSSTANGSSTTLLTLPKAAAAILTATNETMVEGVINHFPFRAPFSASGEITLSAALRTAAKAKVGKVVLTEITRVGNEPEVRVPADLAAALTTNTQATAEWTTTTPMARRDWVLSILAVKQLETRQGRVVKTIDMLAHGKGRVCCFPGVNWITRDFVNKDETWQPLPKSTP